MLAKLTVAQLVKKCHYRGYRNPPVVCILGHQKGDVKQVAYRGTAIWNSAARDLCTPAVRTQDVRNITQRAGICA
jgi:hypothetical protein